MGSSVELGDPKVHYRLCEGCKPNDVNCPIEKFLKDFDQHWHQTKINKMAVKAGLQFKEAYTPSETIDEFGPYEIYTCPKETEVKKQGEVKVYLAPPTFVQKWNRRPGQDGYFPLDPDTES